MAVTTDATPVARQDSPREVSLEDTVARLQAEVWALRSDRQRAECMASIQSDAVQLALDLLVTHPDLRGFFRSFIKRLVDDADARACGVWLLDETTNTCQLWMANIGGETLMADSAEWASLDLPREGMARHLEVDPDVRGGVVQYDGDDNRLPPAVREFNRANEIGTLLLAPLRLPPKTLGWIALANVYDRGEGEGSDSLNRFANECERRWRHALLDATARQATLALYYSRLVDHSLLEARRQAVLEERNRIARDIHDTLAQGFGAILMQLQAAQRAIGSTTPAPVARSVETAVDLARTHLVEARRSVAALRPQSDAREDVPSALGRMVDLAKRTNDVPVDLVIDDLPAFDAGVEREIIGIAQEALTNAMRHSRARRITVHAGAVRGVGFRLSVADDGRGMPADRPADGFGLTSMRERADRIGASLTFVTAPRAGTEVVLAWQPASFSIPRWAGHADR
jgi:signal transduction histidine kinase